MPLPIAYVTARFPPMQTSGTYRVEAVLRHLPGHGFDVRPVTIPDRWIAQQAGRDLVLVDQSGLLQPESATDGLVRKLAEIPVVRRALRSALVPDILSLWARSVPSQLGHPLADARLVYATGPPFSTMILASRLASLLEVPCVQEVRDPPSFNRRLRGRSKSWHRRMLSFERRYLPAADAVIAVTEGTRERLLDLHADLDPERCFVVMNGYPDIDVDPSKAGRDPNRFTVTYVGSFQGGGRGRERSMFNPAVLLPALSGLPPDQVQLRIVGPITGDQQRLINSIPGSEHVEFLGVVERTTAIAELAAADVALVLAEDDLWWIGRKVFEAIAFANRILAVVPPTGDTAKLLAKYEKATIVGLDEIQSLNDVLAGMFTRWRLGGESRDWTRDGTDVQSDQRCVEQIAHVLKLTLEKATEPA